MRRAPGSRRNLRYEFFVLVYAYALRSFLCLSLFTLLSFPCWGDQSASPPVDDSAEAAFGYGKQEWSIAAGYGFGVGLEGSNRGNLKQIRYAAFMPHWAVGRTDPLGEGSWYKGNVDLLIDQSDGFNFSVQGGLGFYYFLLPRLAVTAESRLHHISNAGLHQPNSGINSSLFCLAPRSSCDKTNQFW